MSKERVFEVPESVMSRILNILNQVPYGQIKILMKQLEQIIESEIGQEPDPVVLKKDAK